MIYKNKSRHWFLFLILNVRIANFTKNNVKNLDTIHLVVVTSLTDHYMWIF